MCDKYKDNQYISIQFLVSCTAQHRRMLDNIGVNSVEIQHCIAYIEKQLSFMIVDSHSLSLSYLSALSCSSKPK